MISSSPGPIMGAGVWGIGLGGTVAKKKGATIGERLVLAYTVVHWTTTEYGAQRWLADRIERATGWRPGRATLSRWCSGESEVDERAAKVFEELLSEARAILAEKKRALS